MTDEVPRTIEELNARLEEAEDILNAIRGGEVDALVVSGPHGDQIYTLKGAEHPYRVMVEAMNEGAVTLTGDGTIFYSNRSFAAMLKLPLEKVIGSAMGRFVLPEDLPSYETLIRQGQEGSSKGEVRLQADGGPVVPVHLSLSSLELNATRSVCAVVTDLTQHKRNQELIASEELERTLRAEAEAGRQRMANIFESLTDFFFALDREWRITYVNGRAAAIVGKTRDELIGRTFWDLHPPEKVTEAFEEYRAAMMERVPVHSEGPSRIVEGRWFETHIYPTEGGVAVYFRDMTERKQAEEELREAHERIAMILDSISDNFFALSKDWRFTYLNKRAQEQMRLLLKDPAGLIGKVVWEEFSSVPNEEAVRRVMSERVAITEELYYSPLGEWLENRTYPSSDGGIVTFQRYITGRKRAEERMAYLVKVLASVHDVILATDDQFILTAWNHKAEETYGWKADEVIGRKVTDVIRSEFTDEQRSEAANALAEAGHFYIEVGQYTRDGRRLWMQGHTVALRDETGRITGYVLANRDITERKQAEEELRRSEAHLAEGERLSHTGSWAMNISTGELFWSQEHFRIYGLDPEKAKPSYALVLQYVHPEDRSSLQQTFDNAVRERADYALHFRIVRPDGSIRYIQSMAHPVFNASGDLTEYGGTIIDITERKVAEEALREAHAELAHVTRVTTMGELAASLAHELNQSLAAIMTNGSASLRWLERPRPQLEEATRSVHRIIEDAKRAGGVIAHTRALLKKSVGEKALLDTTEMVREVLVLVKGELSRQRIAFHDHLEKDLPAVQGVRTQLQQVMLNLVMNGIEAMVEVSDRGRELVIRSERHEFDGGSGVLVAVQDAGIGIARENFDRIFEAFFTTKAQGLGLGLSISRSIIEAHGGFLSAQPNAGHGTTFYFVLPSAVDTAQL